MAGCHAVPFRRGQDGIPEPSVKKTLVTPLRQIKGVDPFDEIRVAVEVGSVVTMSVGVG